MGTTAEIHIKQHTDFDQSLDSAKSYARRFQKAYVVETVYPKFDTPIFRSVGEPHIGYAMSSYMVQDANGESVTPIYNIITEIVMVPEITGRLR